MDKGRKDKEFWNFKMSEITQRRQQKCPGSF
jgi:hypothetical protein